MATAYNETCANIANAMFSWRMLGIKGESKYADIMELVLYNSALVGISADGQNGISTRIPLRMNRGQREYEDHRDCTESADREPYIECFCCPPNLVRTIAKALRLGVQSDRQRRHGESVMEETASKRRLLDGSTLKADPGNRVSVEWQGDVHDRRVQGSNPFRDSPAHPRAGPRRRPRLQINDQDAQRGSSLQETFARL